MFTTAEKDTLFKYIDNLDLSLNAIAGWMKTLHARYLDIGTKQNELLQKLTELEEKRNSLLERRITSMEQWATVSKGGEEQGEGRVKAVPFSKET